MYPSEAPPPIASDEEQHGYVSSGVRGAQSSLKRFVRHQHEGGTAEGNGLGSLPAVIDLRSEGKWLRDVPHWLPLDGLSLASTRRRVPVTTGGGHGVASRGLG